MPNILTSWKEIGQYLGKGVRTVQRWEREASLPVHRQGPSRRGVIALTEELDEWARSRTRGPSSAQTEALYREIATLRAAGSDLRTRLEALERRCPAFALANGIDQEGWVTPSVDSIRRNAQAVRSQAVRSQAVRARLAFAYTICAMGEVGYLVGPVNLLEHAQRTAQDVRWCLERPGYIDPNELNDLRSMLTELEARIGLVSGASTLRRDEPVQ